MLLETERLLVAQYGRKLIPAGLTAGTGGNLSVRDSRTGYIAVSPSGMEYDAISPADVTVVSPDGTVADGARRPTSELAMHLGFYAARPDRHAVVHTHSPAATALACLRRSLPPMSYLVALSGRDEVPCAPYRDFGSPALAQAAVGKDLDAAFQLAEELEFCAGVYLRCLAAGAEPVLLTKEEMARARERFGAYGQPKGDE